MKIYKVLIGGRDCLKHTATCDGKLKEGDYIHAYGQMMVKIATSRTPYETTSMFASEIDGPQHRSEHSKYRPATQDEIRKLLPHLSRGKKYSHILHVEMDKDAIVAIGKWRHIKTGNIYTALEYTQVKWNGQWHDAVTYVNNNGDKFVRTTNDFLRSFAAFKGTRYARQQLMKNPILRGLVDEARKAQGFIDPWNHLTRVTPYGSYDDMRVFDPGEIKKVLIDTKLPPYDEVPEFKEMEKQWGPHPVENCECEICAKVRNGQDPASAIEQFEQERKNWLFNSNDKPKPIQLRRPAHLLEKFKAEWEKTLSDSHLTNIIAAPEKETRQYAVNVYYADNLQVTTSDMPIFVRLEVAPTEEASRIYEAIREQVIGVCGDQDWRLQIQRL